MLYPSLASKGLIFGSFLYRKDLHSIEKLTDFWEARFGQSFSFTPESNPLMKYYSGEMGENLSRFFLVTTKSFPREFLLSTKLQALGWEKDWADNDKRMVNVDIGFLTPENFILSTTKNFSHRVYLGQNIFADLTYYFHLGQFQDLPWTYPDYLDQQKKAFLSWCRSFLLQEKS
jgi:hypothetical protein